MNQILIVELLLSKFKTLLSNPEFQSNIIIAIIILFLFAIYHYYFRMKKDGFIQYSRHILFPFTFINGFVVYFIGYQIGDPNRGWDTVFPNFMESFFSTTRLFILGNDMVELKKTIKDNAIFHSMFSLAAALAAFIFISFIAQVFFKDWLVRRKIRKIKKNENHFIFGINQSTLSLSTDLLKNNIDRLVVFVNDLCEFENQQLYFELPNEAYVIRRKSFSENISFEKEEGLFHFFQNKRIYDNQKGNNDNLFHNLKVLKNKINNVETHLYFLTDDEDWNIEHARLAFNELKDCLYVKPVKIHVSIYSGVSEIHFTKFAEIGTSNITVIFHHYASIVSQQLIAEHHPVDSIKIDNKKAAAITDFNVLILGFGQIGMNVLRKLIEQGQFTGSTFHATLIDKYMNTLQGRFENLYPGLKVNYDLNFIEAEAGNSKFYNEIKAVVENTTYIVITLGNDNLNIQTALEILEFNNLRNKKTVKIFIQLENKSHWKETLKELKNQVFIFGEVEKVFSVKNILQSEVEKRAKLVHSVYCKIYSNKNNMLFDNITRHEQLSNISEAEHLYAKVRLLGYKNLNDFLKKNENDSNFINSLSEIQKLNLSIGEHLHWCAFQYVHGWRTLPFDKIKGKDKKEKYKNRKNNVTKVHSCLTSWGKLKELTDILGEDMQKPDEVSVENLYNFITSNLQDDNEKKISTALLLDKSFAQIIEPIARNIHNQWMARRIADGWKYGSERNDQKKEHSSIVPYEDLSESEKEYDRQTVITTLNNLIENGYEIKK